MPLSQPQVWSPDSRCVRRWDWGQDNARVFWEWLDPSPPSSRFVQSSKVTKTITEIQLVRIDVDIPPSPIPNRIFFPFWWIQMQNTWENKSFSGDQFRFSPWSGAKQVWWSFFFPLRQGVGGIKEHLLSITANPTMSTSTTEKALMLSCFGELFFYDDTKYLGMIYNFLKFSNII